MTQKEFIYYNTKLAADKFKIVNVKQKGSLSTQLPFNYVKA
jgi:hypothetical protein